MHTHLTGYMCRDDMSALQLNPEHCVRQCFGDHTVNLDCVLLCHNDTICVVDLFESDESVAKNLLDIIKR